MDGLAPTHHVLHAGTCLSDRRAPARHRGEKPPSCKPRGCCRSPCRRCAVCSGIWCGSRRRTSRSEEHTSELQSHRDLHSFPTRRSSDLGGEAPVVQAAGLLPLTVPEVRRLLWHLVWEQTAHL